MAVNGTDPLAPAMDTHWEGFSIQERDRRWKAVRDNAARAELDAVLVPLCLDGRNYNLSQEQVKGTRSDSRYLTQRLDAAFVLPTDGRQPVALTPDGSGNSWLDDVRPAPGPGRTSWGHAIADVMTELGLERGRIGISGLTRGKVTHVRSDEGVVSYTAYVELQRRLPNASFLGGTDVIGYARYVKSDEEIACLRRGTAIAQAGIQEMIDVARPGLDEAVLYGRVAGRMLELGAEYHPLALYTGFMGEKYLRNEDPPQGRTLQPGYVITNEVAAVWGGLVAQELQPIVLGPVPDAWKPVIELYQDLYDLGMQMMKPGTTFGEFMDAVNELGPKRGMRSLMLIHGRGYGNDGPILTPQETGAKIRDVVIQAGNAWVWKPIAYSANGKIAISTGGVVVVTEQGAERLVPRDMPPVVSVE